MHLQGVSGYGNYKRKTTKESLEIQWSNEVLSQPIQLKYNWDWNCRSEKVQRRSQT